MAKTSPHRKKYEILTAKIQKCFNELEIPLEALFESKDLIILSSPVMNANVNFNVQVSILRKSKLIGVKICKYEKIDESEIDILIEFANRVNKLYGDVGYLTINPAECLIMAHFAAELIEDKINTTQLKTGFEMVVGNTLSYFEFIEGADVGANSSGELLLKYIEYNKVRKNFQRIMLN